jgi:DNA-binding NarL/FixJ family response regulator
MAKKKPLCEEESPVKSNKPEFKPGNKPYLEYDGCVLNANVPWDELLSDLIASGFTYKMIAKEIGTKIKTLKAVKTKDFENLSFRAGARMITMHSEARPQHYLDF